MELIVSATSNCSPL